MHLLQLDLQSDVPLPRGTQHERCGGEVLHCDPDRLVQRNFGGASSAGPGAGHELPELDDRLRVAGRGEFEEAVRGADVVHATTASPEPVVRIEWLSPGAHVSSVGSTLEGGSELDPAIVERAEVVVVEQRDSAFAPLPAGAPELEPRGRDGVVELGEIIAGAAAGRTSPEQITLYKSVGVAVQDLAAAALVLAAATARGAGQEIELEEIHA